MVCSFKLVKELSRIMPKKGDDDWRHQGFKGEFDPAMQGSSKNVPEIVIEDVDEGEVWMPWKCDSSVNFM
jgi:hypothetical protein